MSEQNNPQAEGAAAQQPDTLFKIQRIYLKDLSFEAPLGVEGFTKNAQPNVEQELNTQITRIDDNNHEVVLLLTIAAKIDGRTVFLVEVKQAGLFAVKGFEGMQLSQLLNTTCAQILFPYAREAVDNMLTRGTFPPLMMPPINFEAVFAQAVAQARQQSAAPAEGTSIN